jgi:hypothetical protein
VTDVPSGMKHSRPYTYLIHSKLSAHIISTSHSPKCVISKAQKSDQGTKAKAMEVKVKTLDTLGYRLRTVVKRRKMGKFVAYGREIIGGRL